MGKPGFFLGLPPSEAGAELFLLPPSVNNDPSTSAWSVTSSELIPTTPKSSQITNLLQKCLLLENIIKKILSGIIKPPLSEHATKKEACSE